ncbi:unnamed protein product [Parascedosporium putredinis]|uniref:Uncharacterized protein n=1 Tax=Parascedosporium putredinis TaxID=1442378 RepID=A0A9P1H1U3_9PEZI|nr:unnamed protein product [Parascedosporium putredinis]CAI7993978.1 unnamed protein product [Parascedosporium putredinis]
MILQSEIAWQTHTISIFKSKNIIPKARKHVNRSPRFIDATMDSGGEARPETRVWAQQVEAEKAADDRKQPWKQHLEAEDEAKMNQASAPTPLPQPPNPQPDPPPSPPPPTF